MGAAAREVGHTAGCTSPHGSGQRPFVWGKPTTFLRDIVPAHNFTHEGKRAVTGQT